MIRQTNEQIVQIMQYLIYVYVYACEYYRKYRAAGFTGLFFIPFWLERENSTYTAFRLLHA